jgi:hypothetical protein
MASALIAEWAASSIFSPSPPGIPFDDVVATVDVTSIVVGGSAWEHTIVIQYKPESPISHVAFEDAQQAFAGPHTVDYCGCASRGGVQVTVRLNSLERLLLAKVGEHSHHHIITSHHWLFAWFELFDFCFVNLLRKAC